MAQGLEVRRNRDGSIDFGFYRAHAQRRRRAVKRKLGRSAWRHGLHLLNVLADRIWPDRHPKASNRVRATMHLAIARCRSRDDCN